MEMMEQILLIAVGILVLLTLALLALVVMLSSRVSALSNRDVLNKCEELRRELTEGQRVAHGVPEPRRSRFAIAGRSRGRKCDETP